jgi:putative transposase
MGGDEMKHMKDYAYHYGLKVRIYPSDRQKEIIQRNADAARFVYNELVAVNKETGRFSRRNIYIDFIEQRVEELRDLIHSPKILKDCFPWLRHEDIDAQSIANAKQNYQKAWQKYRRIHAAGRPRFHRKDSPCSYQTNPHYAKSLWSSNVRFLDVHHLVLPKLKRIRFQGSKKI